MPLCGEEGLLKRLYRRLDFQFASYLSIIKALAFVSDLYFDNWGGIAEIGVGIADLLNTLLFFICNSFS